ncbi:hypothetical protein FC09_GL000551 [Lactobacillus delbrueckii subsp. indicus DSM 15996]|nr:hypothetical protein FC09_GL000551 [Lactobacillus delbrueckii subsp. indicus DSM 15996]
MKSETGFQLICRYRLFWSKKDAKSEKAEKISQKGLTDLEKFANINVHDLE